jgi:hypothetical protein
MLGTLIDLLFIQKSFIVIITDAKLVSGVEGWDENRRGVGTNGIRKGKEIFVS